HQSSSAVGTSMVDWGDSLGGGPPSVAWAVAAAPAPSRATAPATRRKGLVMVPPGRWWWDGIGSVAAAAGVADGLLREVPAGNERPGEAVSLAGGRGQVGAE